MPKVKLLLNLINIILLLIISAIILGCQSLSIDNPFSDSNQPEAPGTPLALETPKPLSTAADSIPSNPQPTVITLTLWTVDSVAPYMEGIDQHLQTFQAENPNTQVAIYQKNSSGQSSSFNYLMNAKDVAPALIPDVVMLPTAQIPLAWRANLIQPLDGSLDRTIIQDMLPIATALGTVDERLAAIPFQIDLSHLVYNTQQITSTPLLWSDVLSSGQRYQFPAKSQTGLLNDASTIHYLSTGAILVNENSEAVVDETALLSLLNFYQSAIETQILSPDILNATQPAEQWPQYTSGEVAMTHVNVHQYLQERNTLTNSSVSVIPSPQGEATTLPRGVAFALITTDPSRQLQAIELIESFMQTEVNAAWAVQANVIPTRQSAFNQVAGDDPYWAFLREYLSLSTVLPSDGTYQELSRVLQHAVSQVIGGEATPQKATQDALDSLRK